MIWLVPLALAIPREAVLDSAAQYTTHVWTATSANTTSVSCSSDWESDYGPGTYTALPYDWGGYMTLAEFDEQIAAGYGAGSHSWHGSLWCTAGVDCSGFVSELWQSGHYATSTFYAVTSDIGWSDLKRGDAINDAGSHIVLYTHESEGGWPVFYESCGSYGVRLNSTGGWGYVSGYQPVRYDDIEDGPSTGTAGTPIEIAAFPYEDSRWTAGATSDTLDGYSCSPSSNEAGPEMLYHFYARTAGTLEAVVSDASGVDIDLHVLTAPSADACLVRDDTNVSIEVGPGDVWLSLDTWVSSSGTEYPGPYILTATFTGQVGEESGDSGAQGGDSGSDSGADSGVDGGDGEQPGDDGSRPDDQGVTAGAASVLPGEASLGPGAGCGCTTGAGSGTGAGFGLLVGVAALRRRRQVAGG